MTTIREIFHTIANWHNKITIASGCTREILATKSFEELSKEELKIKQKKLMEVFSGLESDAINANKSVIQLKEAIYKNIDPEKEI